MREYEPDYVPLREKTVVLMTMVCIAVAAFWIGYSFGGDVWKRRAIKAGVAEYVIDPPDSNLGQFRWKKQ